MIKKEVALLGMHSSYKAFDFDKDIEVWCINHMHILEGLERWDKWFEFHSLSNIKNRFKESKTCPRKYHYDWLKAQEKPIYMRQKYKQIPSSIAYPIREVLKRFDPIMTNTFDYLITLAIMMQYTDIHIYGIMFESLLEFLNQRMSYSRLIGYAEGAGIRVHLSGENDLWWHTDLYCFEKEKNVYRT